ncbi:MAG: GHMP family kinase ATP-binding protein [Candidatus Poseidoniales archaeon]|jgi:pantoate kinase
MGESTTHVGGHITLLFSISDDALLPRRQGSRGAGLCLKDGVKVTIERYDNSDEESSSEIIVNDYNDQIIEGEHELLADLLEAFHSTYRLSEDISHRVVMTCELPLSQGFGMSAAGLLACALALGEIHGVDDIGPLVRLAHRIERQHSAGLGDVLGLWAGGVALRTNPGSPPYPGKARGFSIDSEAILVWVVGASRHTSQYIDNAEWKRAINKAGNSSVKRLADRDWKPEAWPELLMESDRFAIGSGMLNEKDRSDLLADVHALVIQEGFGETASCHLCMLGSSLVILPKDLTNKPVFTEELLQKIKHLGYGVMLTRIE